MGKLEQNSRKKAKRKNLQRVILETVAFTGVLGVGLLAPNVIKSLTKLSVISKQRQREYIGSSASKMVKKGLMKFNGKYYELTTLGEKRLRRWKFAGFKLQKPKRWDGKWRVLIFDIPEKLKKTRNYLTTLLKQAGFVRLQDSVWVYPHDCEDVIALLKIDFGIGKYLLYLIVEELENDRYLRDEFDLV